MQIWHAPVQYNATWKEDRTPTYCTKQCRDRESPLPSGLGHAEDMNWTWAGQKLKASQHHCTADSCQNTQQWHPQAHWVLKQSTLFFCRSPTVFPGFTAEDCWHAPGGGTDRGSPCSDSRAWRRVEGGKPALPHCYITIFWCSSDVHEEMAPKKCSFFFFLVSLEHKQKLKQRKW